jgi:UDP-N-acetylmuramoyl-tripeptide--D-alanyl-D-alanine ligase
MPASKARSLRLTRGRLLGALALGVVLTGGLVLWWRWGDHTTFRLLTESPFAGRCNKELTRDPIVRSLELGTRFMLAHQKPAGNFDYEYDWLEKSYTDDDNEVRQAGALWGLALLYQDRPTSELGAAVERGLAFFDRHSVRTPSGARCVAYPDKASPGIGTVALVALSYIEYLGAARDLAPERRALHESRLAEYLNQLVASVNADGLWSGNYDPHTCVASGAPSPYSDGEALLTLVKAARYAGHPELRPLIVRTADAGHRLNVVEALERDPDSDTTKGYYQWSSMSFYELATSGWPDSERFGKILLDLADWQIDVHKTLTRVRNTGYAYEGIIPAYDWARRKRDARADKLACVIDLGLGRLLSWQVGGPLASSFTRRVAPGERFAIGGVQNEARAPALRIDVTQHQMHALIFAKNLVYTR